MKDGYGNELNIGDTVVWATKLRERVGDYPNHPAVPVRAEVVAFANTRVWLFVLEVPGHVHEPQRAHDRIQVDPRKVLLERRYA